jgi:hypothetical protein
VPEDNHVHHGRELFDALATAPNARRAPLMITPDFDQIAFAIVQRIWGNTELDQPGLIIETQAVAEQLRLIWNARGAADVAKMELELSTVMGSTMAGPYCKNLDRAIRKLDR